MRIFKRAFGVALAFAVVLFQQSCDNSYGIFEEVQKEREQKGQDIFKKKSVTNIVRYGGDYYASTASLYRRATAAGSDWTRVDDLPGSGVYGLAEDGALLYASTDAGVYSFNGSAWTVLGGAPTGIEKLFTTTDGELFLVRHAVDTSDPVQSTYTLYHYSAGTFTQVAGFAPAANKTIRGVAFDGAAYWFASEDHLYSSASADGGALTDRLGDFTGLGSSTIWNLCTAGTNTYVTTTGGTIYRVGSAAGISVSSIALTAVAAVPRNSGTDFRIVVGTQNLTASDDSKGYFEFMSVDSIATFSSSTFVPGESGTIAGSSSVYSTTVYDLPVNALLYDGTNASGTLLVGISSYTSSGTHYGLYSSRWTGSSWSGWEAE